jgi:hypothetical protein
MTILGGIQSLDPNKPFTVIKPYVMYEPDELQFVDADIREAFEGKAYLTGTPTMAQLSREIRALTFAMKEKK